MRIHDIAGLASSAVQRGHVWVSSDRHQATTIATGRVARAMKVGRQSVLHPHSFGSKADLEIAQVDGIVRSVNAIEKGK